MQPPRVRCPEFPQGLTWINSPRSLSVANDLRGRVTLLDFWTYCCINCLHVLPVLERVEQAFARDPVQVVGVHCAKFPAEQDPGNVCRAVRRHHVQHPVVVDAERAVSSRFAVRAWPTLVLVDSAGYVRETLSGEVEFELLSLMVRALLDEGREKGTLSSEGPLEGFAPSESGAALLHYPGRVHRFADLLFVADSGHNRIVVSDLEGRIRRIVGAGDAGSRDGPADSSAFSNPQGLAVSSGCLYVADTGNHQLRSVDLQSFEVTTVAGTGAKGTAPKPGHPSRPRETPLRSPWGLLTVGGQVLIAMAGSHQIWIFDSRENLLAPWAGSGREDHVDGLLLEAAFAQPSGLARAGKFVLVADSETSSVRAIDLLEGRVKTIVGQGLFDFGDTDGTPREVLLQHPLDLAAGPDTLYIADTYNNKIKAIHFGSMHTRTLLGDGNSASLHEPGGIAFDGERLYIADTNHHRILVGNPSSGSLLEMELQAGESGAGVRE